MTFEKFKQQIDDLEERRRIVKQVEEEKLNGYIRTLAKNVTETFAALSPYIDYCTEACGLTNREKCITCALSHTGVMRIRWMDDWFESKIEIKFEIGGGPRIDFTTSCDDLQLGRLKDLNTLHILQNSVFKAEKREYLVNQLTKDLYDKIEKDELYVRS